MLCFELIDISQGSTRKEGIRKVVTGAEIGKSSFFSLNASPLKRNFLLLELKEFRCKCKQFPPYELLGFPSPPIVKAISGTKYRFLTENTIRDGGGTAL